MQLNIYVLMNGSCEDIVAHIPPSKPSHDRRQCLYDRAHGAQPLLGVLRKESTYLNTYTRWKIFARWAGGPVGSILGGHDPAPTSENWNQTPRTSETTSQDHGFRSCASRNTVATSPGRETSSLESGRRRKRKGRNEGRKQQRGEEISYAVVGANDTSITPTLAAAANQAKWVKLVRPWFFMGLEAFIKNLSLENYHCRVAILICPSMFLAGFWGKASALCFDQGQFSAPNSYKSMMRNSVHMRSNPIYLHRLSSHIFKLLGQIC